MKKLFASTGTKVVWAITSQPINLAVHLSSLLEGRSVGTSKPKSTAYKVFYSRKTF